MRSIPPPQPSPKLFRGDSAISHLCYRWWKMFLSYLFDVFSVSFFFLAFYLPFASFHFALNFIASELCDLQLDKQEPGVAISSSLFGNS